MSARAWLNIPEKSVRERNDDDALTPRLEFRAACLGEYRRRLLAIYVACAGWSRPAVARLWPWVDWASECFEREDAEGWLGALAELERYVGR